MQNHQPLRPAAASTCGLSFMRFAAGAASGAAGWDCFRLSLRLSAFRSRALSPRHRQSMGRNAIICSYLGPSPVCVYFFIPSAAMLMRQQSEQKTERRLLISQAPMILIRRQHSFLQHFPAGDF